MRIKEKIGVRVPVALTAAVALTLGMAPLASASTAAKADSAANHWVTSWSASIQGDSTLGGAGAELLSGHSAVQFLKNFVPSLPTFSNQTIRQVMYLHHQGSKVRVELSNEFGKAATTFPSVTFGLRAGNDGANVASGTLRQVTVDGKQQITIPAGATVLSDPIDLPVKAFDSAVLSMFVPAGSPAASVHGSSMQQFYTTDGDQTSSQDSSDFLAHGLVGAPNAGLLPGTLGANTTAEYYAARIETESTADSCTLVAFGDSITDGYAGSVNTNSRYPDYLARRLAADPATQHISVANEAISGGRVTADGIGPSALHRLDRDITSQPNVCGAIIHQGINDIGTAGANGLPVAPEQIIDGYKSVASQLHAKGIPVLISTLQAAGDLTFPTFYGFYSTPLGNAFRSQVNNWVRTEGSKYFDGVVDYDAVTRDPNAPEHIAGPFNSGDDLHPNDRGYQAMANAVPQQFLNSLHR